MWWIFCISTATAYLLGRKEGVYSYRKSWAHFGYWTTKEGNISKKDQLKGIHGMISQTIAALECEKEQ